jgi:membrane associated rhomboid family serine protease
VKEKVLHKKMQKIIQESPMCVAIIFVNILLYLTLKLMPEMMEVLALHPEAGMLAQRPWTLVTVFFLHEVGVHIFGTMLIVFYAGSKLEKVIGSARLLLIFLLAGIAGSLSMLAVSSFVETSEVSAGASAAALGILGASGMVPLKDIARSLNVKKIIIVVFITNIFMLIFNVRQFAGSTLAHLAGIAVGVIFGWWYKKQMPAPQQVVIKRKGSQRTGKA